MDCRIVKTRKMKLMTKIVWAVVITLTQIQTLTAQTPGFDDDVQDVPVNQWIIPMMVLGILFAANSINFFKINNNIK